MATVAGIFPYVYLKFYIDINQAQVYKIGQKEINV